MARSSRRSGKNQQVQAFHASFQGPLPPPSMLAKYDEILPGFAERLLSMTEKQATHRQSIEATVVQSSVSSEKTGVVLGFILSLIVISGGFVMVWAGKNVEGLVAILAPLATLASVFVYGKRNQRKELAEKRQVFLRN